MDAYFVGSLLLGFYAVWQMWLEVSVEYTATILRLSEYGWFVWMLRWLRINKHAKTD
jgi:hypothetical protein